MKKIFLIASLLLIVFVNSCLKPDREGDENEPKQNEIVATKDLCFYSFIVSAKNNAKIYDDVVFLQDENSYKAEIKHYKTDLSNLIVTFATNASKVTVNGTEQKSEETINNFTKALTYKLLNSKGEYREFTVTLVNTSYTGVPILVISTEGGKAITSKDNWLKGIVSIDKQDGIVDYDNFKDSMEIKGRGHNTWSVDKKPYTFKLSSSSKVMGMKKSKRWVLLANASDKTLLRNKVAFEIGKRTSLAWTPDSRYIEVVLNGKYLGSYLLCEQIRVEPNRLNITEISDKETSGDGITGGFLFEIDRYYDEDPKFKTTICNLPIMFKDEVNATQIAYAKKYFNDLEDLLYNGDVKSSKYAEYLDVDSFVDWWIIHELTHNTEPRLPGSCYMYKDKLGKMTAGPIWDFDQTTFKDSKSFELMDGKALWYAQLFKHEDFKKRAKERWIELKQKFESIPEFIDNEMNMLTEAADRNWKLWTLTTGQNQDEALSWRDAVAKMRLNYINRLHWMNEQIMNWSTLAE